MTVKRRGRSVEVTGHDSEGVQGIVESVGLREFLNE